MSAGSHRRMARESHIGQPHAAEYCRAIKPYPPEATEMEYIWLFLLFFAVLAAAWFYLQRAKARPSASSAPATEAAPTPAATAENDERAAP